MPFSSRVRRLADFHPIHTHSHCAVPEHDTVTSLTHRISHTRVFDSYYWSSPHELSHRPRVWTRCPSCAACWCVFLSFSSPPSRPEVLIDHDEGVGGSDSVPEAQPDVSQAEKLDEISSSDCCCIPSGVFRPFTSMCSGSKNNHSQCNVDDAAEDQGTQMGQRPSDAGAQIRAYFLTIAETSLA